MNKLLSWGVNSAGGASNNDADGSPDSETCPNMVSKIFAITSEPKPTNCSRSFCPRSGCIEASCFVRCLRFVAVEPSAKEAFRFCGVRVEERPRVDGGLADAMFAATSSMKDLLRAWSSSTDGVFTFNRKRFERLPSGKAGPACSLKSCMVLESPSKAALLLEKMSWRVTASLKAGKTSTCTRTKRSNKDSRI